MELRHLRFFVAVADAGSLTVAAEQKQLLSRVGFVPAVISLIVMYFVQRPIAALAGKRVV